jgi:cobalt/nickel transport system permease protein
MPADFLDRYSRGSTVCHRLSSRLKILVALSIVAAAALLPVSLWPLHGCLALLVLAGLSLAEIPLHYLARRLLLFVPMVALMALVVPLSRGFRGGWEIGAAILVRSTVAFLAGIWLVSSTPFDRLLAGLRGLGMPRFFVAMLAFVYRYLFVLFDELARMRTAQRARTFGRPGLRASWKGSVNLVGGLLVRSMNRAERIHGAMCARGWSGEVHTLD